MGHGIILDGRFVLHIGFGIVMVSGNGFFRKDLSFAGAWAFSVGTSVGWGSLVVTSNTYLAQAGPAGSVGGLVVGMLVMLLIARCFSFLMGCFPEAGGAYAFTRNVFGYDHGFLTAWFLSLVYLAVLWANTT